MVHQRQSGPLICLAAADKSTGNRCPAGQPAWPEDPEGDVEKINAWIYETYSDNPWQDVILKWERQYQVILEEASKIPEKDLLDTDKYAWLKGYSVAVYLLGTYDHHREHLETILAWLEQQ